ncbi:hypothetical protein OG474_30155 [Kribbella sp. NBC_01505]|uniref:hypothetical protein n=1 Tax=Kribbella sp. NBC_01505 TaxID=2903580 RepID=UPI003864A7E4
MAVYLFVPMIPETFVGWVRVTASEPVTWMTPDEAEELADSLREAALHARYGK